MAEELREALRQVLMPFLRPEVLTTEAADAVLALPEMAGLIGAQEQVARVEALAELMNRDPWHKLRGDDIAVRIHRALDGDATTGGTT